MNQRLNIAGRLVGPGQPCYVIAEAGSNHDGSFDQAVALIEAAAQAGADAVKFQAIRYDRLWVPELESPEHRAFYTAIELPEDWLPRLHAAAVERGLHFLCSPTYLESVALIAAAGAPAFKIASPQAVGDPLILRAVAATGRPAILSTGYADLPRIERAVRELREAGIRELAILQCVAEYPASGPRVNLRAMSSLGERFGIPAGLSDHTEGIHVAPAAVAMGACIIEKHFTTDRTRPGPDHHFALEPAELRQMIRNIRDVEACLGDGRRDSNTPQEREQTGRLEVRATARDPIPAGSLVKADRVMFRRAPAGLPVHEFEAFRSPVATRAIAPGTPITAESLRESAS